MTERRPVDLSVVDPEDRPYMKKIILRVVNWHQPQPRMTIRIHANDDHYNVVFFGWDQAINDYAFYNTFLKTDGLDRRDSDFDMIIDTETVPTVDAETSDDITGPMKVFRIKRSGTSLKKRK